MSESDRARFAQLVAGALYDDSKWRTTGLVKQLVEQMGHGVASVAPREPGIPELVYLQGPELPGGTAPVFRPELLGVWATATDVLTRSGLRWLSHYDSIDLDHELDGFEVTGIVREGDAFQAYRALSPAFPQLTNHWVYYEDRGLSVGWRARITRYAPSRSDEFGGDEQ